MSTPQSMHHEQELEARMSRFGLRVAAGLTEFSEHAPADVSERLRFAREQAMAKSRSARANQAELAPALLPQGNTLALGGTGGRHESRWLKLASLMPLLLLVLGLLLIQHSQWYQQIRAAADIDAALLTDKLPPAAYGDPGFTEYLSDTEQDPPQE